MAAAQGSLPIPSEYQDIFDKISVFLYTIARWIGQAITGVVQSLVPTVKIPDSLINAIGFLALLTVFLVIAEVAKRLVWIIVLIGWVLIVIRIVMTTI